jgi:phosphotransacetylase
MDPIEIIRDRAKKELKKIVLPESEDERVFEAGLRLTREKNCPNSLSGECRIYSKEITKRWPI